MSKPEENKSERELDCSNAGRGVWLVKIPKYIASQWIKVPGDVEVGKLKIVKYPGQKSEVSLTLSEATMQVEPKEKIPKDHRFDVQAVTQQTLGVFSQILVNNASAGDSDTKPEKISMEGTIVEKLECRPYADETYMNLKAKSIFKLNQPKRKVELLDNAVTKFKPVSDHKHNIEYEKKKKTDGKKSRTEKEAVKDMLFNAFEKHQYYNIKDLVSITNQPIGYVKEILKEICDYSVKNPHKNTWYLKPEYRHYNEDKKDKKDDAKDAMDDDDDDF